MSDKNHRRKNKRHHKAYFGWVSAKAYRQMEWRKWRACERDALVNERYDRLPYKMLPTAWYATIWY